MAKALTPGHTSFSFNGTTKLTRCGYRTCFWTRLKRVQPRPEAFVPPRDAVDHCHIGKIHKSQSFFFWCRDGARVMPGVTPSCKSQSSPQPYQLPCRVVCIIQRLSISRSRRRSICLCCSTAVSSTLEPSPERRLPNHPNTTPIERYVSRSLPYVDLPLVVTSPLYLVSSPTPG